MRTVEVIQTATVSRFREIAEVNKLWRHKMANNDRSLSMYSIFFFLSVFFSLGAVS
ncbi:hypothetical protein PoB_004126800, partial [Plakobranchus ocellatus]